MRTATRTTITDGKSWTISCTWVCYKKYNLSWTMRYFIAVNERAVCAVWVASRSFFVASNIRYQLRNRTNNMCTLILLEEGSPLPTLTLLKLEMVVYHQQEPHRLTSAAWEEEKRNKCLPRCVVCKINGKNFTLIIQRISIAESSVVSQRELWIRRNRRRTNVLI